MPSSLIALDAISSSVLLDDEPTGFVNDFYGNVGRYGEGIRTELHRRRHVQLLVTGQRVEPFQVPSSTTSIETDH